MAIQVLAIVAVLLARWKGVQLISSNVTLWEAVEMVKVAANN